MASASGRPGKEPPRFLPGPLAESEQIDMAPVPPAQKDFRTGHPAETPTGAGDPLAALTEAELLNLYSEATEDELVSRLRDTADAARRAASAYSRKAARFEAIAEEFDEATRKEEEKLRLARSESGTGEPSSGSASPRVPASSATDPGKEMRW